jgi:hypothetical protein
MSLEGQIRKIINFETKILSNLVYGRPTISRKEKAELLKLLEASYSLLTPSEKKARLQLLEGLRVKSEKLKETESFSDFQSLFTVTEELKKYIFENISGTSHSVKLLKGPKHAQFTLTFNYLVPLSKKNEIKEQNDVNDLLKMKTLARSLGKIIFCQC